MKNLIKLLSITLVALMFSQCDKPNNLTPVFNGEIISHCRNKELCQYGYLIKIGNDTVLTADNYIYDVIGDNPVLPLNVDIEVISIDMAVCKYERCEVLYLSVKSNLNDKRP